MMTDLCRYVADSYLQTDEGQAEAQRAKREGSKLYLQAKEVVLRPGVAGGLAGAGTHETLVLTAYRLTPFQSISLFLAQSDTSATRTGTSPGIGGSFQLLLSDYSV